MTLLLIAPGPIKDSCFLPGGQVTATSGLLSELSATDTRVFHVNTIPPSITRLPRLAYVTHIPVRVFTATLIILKHRPDGALFFCGTRLNMTERLFLTVVAELFGTRTGLFFRNTTLLAPQQRFTIPDSILRFVLRIPSKLYVQGSNLCDRLQQLRLPRRNITVIPNWLPPDILVADKPKRITNKAPISFLFASHANKNKGLLDIIEAAALLRHREDFCVYIIGDGNATRLGKELIEHYQLTNVIWLGWKERSEVIRWLDRSHIFTLPTYHDEGFPNAILEAMARGLPVISTDAGAITDSVIHGRNGYIIPPRSPEALSRAMLAYLEDPTLVTKHSEATLRIARERHDRTANCQKLLDDLFAAGK